MTGNQIGQTRRLARLRNGGKRLFGDVLLDLGVAFEFLGDGAHQRLDGGQLATGFVQLHCARLEEGGVFDEVGDLHPRLAFDQHLDGAIGQFQQLQHIGQHADAVDAIGGRIVDGGVDLADSRICLSSAITSSSARTDFSRPTNSGTIMCGKTTMSRSGRTG